MQTPVPFPQIHPLGLTGLLVQFADRLSQPANRAAIAFRSAVEAERWAGVEETSSSLASTYVRFDPLRLSHTDLAERLKKLLAQADWYSAVPPQGRKLWQIPTHYGGGHGPQLAEAAALAGQTEAEAIATLSTARTRVLTLGFAPGQPYLGELPAQWDIPRQSAITPQVPSGALVVAVRQFVLFANPSPTGWRHIGQTAFRCFRPELEDPFTLAAGDEVEFPSVTAEEFANIQADPRSNGAASVGPLP